MDWQLLATLDAHERDALLARARSRRFARNEVICHAGDPADSLHLVECGHLAVRGSVPSGLSVTFNILGPGDFFGELALLRKDGRRTATVVALEEARTLSLDARTFNRMCARNPRMERVLSTLLADRVDRLSGRLLEALYVGLDRRVYRRLVELAGSFGAVDNRASIPLSQVNLADLVGATRPSVNQVLHRLANLGLVEVHRGRIELLDIAALERRYAG